MIYSKCGNRTKDEVERPLFFETKKFPNSNYFIWNQRQPFFLPKKCSFYKKTYTVNKWKINIRGKHPLIMDFSKQTKCDLSLITYLEGRKDQKVADYVSCNIKINLNEKIIDLCDKIEIFLQYMVKLYNVQSKKCDICNTIKRMKKYIIDIFNTN